MVTCTNNSITILLTLIILTPTQDEKLGGEEARIKYLEEICYPNFKKLTKMIKSGGKFFLGEKVGIIIKPYFTEAMALAI